VSTRVHAVLAAEQEKILLLDPFAKIFPEIWTKVAKIRIVFDNIICSIVFVNRAIATSARIRTKNRAREGSNWEGSLG